MTNKRKKKHKREYSNLPEPNVSYSSIAWYCVNSNYRWNFVSEYTVLYLVCGSLIEDMKPDFLRLYHLLHQYQKNDDKTEIISLYNKLHNDLPGMISAYMESSDLKLKSVIDIMEKMSHTKPIDSGIYEFISKKCDENSLYFKIVFPYLKEYIASEIYKPYSSYILLKNIINNREWHDKIISFEERKTYIDKLWDLFYHSTSGYKYLNMFQEFMKILESRFLKSQFEYCFKMYNEYTISTSVAHCIEYLSKN